MMDPHPACCLSACIVHLFLCLLVCNSLGLLCCCEQEEEEGIGDVDLFTLTEDRNKLVVNVKWLQHLQVCSPAAAAVCSKCLLWCPVLNPLATRN